MTLEEATEFFSSDSYATKTTGIVIDKVSTNYSKCHIDLDERHLAAGGHVMGGVLFTLGDFAFAVAANTPDKLTMTSNACINYLTQPKDKKVVAECICLKNGRTTCYYETRITDGLGNLVAVFSANGFHIN